MAWVTAPIEQQPLALLISRVSEIEILGALMIFDHGREHVAGSALKNGQRLQRDLFGSQSASTLNSFATRM